MQAQAPVRTYMWSKSSAASEWRQNCFCMFGCDCNESYNCKYAAMTSRCSDSQIRCEERCKEKEMKRANEVEKAKTDE